MTDDEARLVRLIRGCPWFVTALRAGRAVGAPDRVIGAGAIRDLVFEHLHDRLAPPPRDVDYAFFDPAQVTADLFETRLARWPDLGTRWPRVRVVHD
jgi:hypothetical protein